MRSLFAALAAAACLVPSLGCELAHSDVQVRWYFHGNTCATGESGSSSAAL